MVRRQPEASRQIRRTNQREALRDLMLSAAKCGAWLTLNQLARLTHYGEASISAQLRHLRKLEHGGFVLSKRCRHRKRAAGARDLGPLWEYQLRRGVRERGRGKRTRRSQLSSAHLSLETIRGMVRAARQLERV
jgi:hypothetical protein